MWGSAATEPPGGGFGRGVPPPAENFAILGTENHVLMHFRTTFWGYNVDYLLCLVHKISSKDWMVQAYPITVMFLVLLVHNTAQKKKKKKKKKRNLMPERGQI